MSRVEGLVGYSLALFGLPESLVEENVRWVERRRQLLLDRAIDSALFLNAAIDAGYSVLFEGVQGPVIDVEHGTYPFVTTSPTASYSVTMGSGVDLTRVRHRVGVLKVYQTMVGGGAFVTEDHSESGARLRRDGQEYGTTTGRERRCGWLDLVHARWAVMLNRYDSLVLTRLDVLDAFDTIDVCIAYDMDGTVTTQFRPEQGFLSRCRPIYRRFEGWRTSTTDVASYYARPRCALQLVDFIHDYLDVHVAGVTNGPRDVDLLVQPGSSLLGLLA